MQTLTPTLKDEIAETIKAAVDNRKTIVQQIETLQAQLAEKKKAYQEAETRADAINKQRTELLCQGKSARSIYAEYDKAILERGRLTGEIELIENKAIPEKHKELNQAQTGVKNVIDRVLNEHRLKTVEAMQAAISQADDVFCQWKDLAASVCRENGVSFNADRHFDPLKDVALSDRFREALKKRTGFRIAKLVRRD